MELFPKSTVIVPEKFHRQFPEISELPTLVTSVGVKPVSH